MDLKFGTDKKLKSRKRIERLFSDGKRYSGHGLTVVYFVDKSQNGEFKVAVSVPKRKIKKAVERNLIKRRIREAFRLNQNRLKPGYGLELMFIYTYTKPIDFQKIEKSMLFLIDYLNSVSTVNTSA